MEREWVERVVNKEDKPTISVSGRRTPMEVTMEIKRLYGLGVAPLDVAQAVGVSVTTVRSHTKDMKKKVTKSIPKKREVTPNPDLVEKIKNLRGNGVSVKDILDILKICRAAYYKNFNAREANGSTEG